MKKNLRQCLNRLLATFVILLAALPSSAARSYVFALNGDGESISPSYYYGDYQKAEPTRLTGTYEKITSIPSEGLSGTYLIVGATNAKTPSSWNSSAWYDVSDVTISSNTITNPTSGLEFVLERINGNDYYIKQNNRWLYYGTSLERRTEQPTTNQGKWTITVSSGKFTIANKNSPTYHFVFNKRGASYYKYQMAATTSTNFSEYYEESRFFKKQAATTYSITIDDAIENGTVTTSPASSTTAGTTVTVTATPDEGYELTALSYNDGSDHEISIASTPYTFTMPASNVTVSATFAAPCRSVGTSAGTAYGPDYTPLDAHYKYSYNQIVYAGSTLPTVISSIGFMYAGDMDQDFKGNVSIYLGDIDASASLSGWRTHDKLTKVYSGTMYFDDANNGDWTDFDFNVMGHTSFVHNPDSNLVVVVYDNSGAYTASYGAVKFHYANAGSGNSVHKWARADYTSDGYISVTDGSSSSPTIGASADQNLASTENYYPIARFCGDFAELLAIIIDDMTNGTVTATPSAAPEGATVTLRAIPDAGYEVGSVSVTTAAKADVPLTDNGDGTYEFTMPAAAVTVSAEFEAVTYYYRKVTDASRTDWSGTYLLAGQNTNSSNPNSTMVYTGASFSNLVTSTVSVPVSDGFITNPSGVVEVDIEYVTTASNVKYYRVSFTNGDSTYYLGRGTSAVKTAYLSGSTPPTGNAYLWSIVAQANNSADYSYDFGNVKIQNKNSTTNYLIYRGPTYNLFTANTNGYTTNYSTGTGGAYSAPKLYEKVYKVTVSDLISNGTVEVDKEYAAAGETVTVTTHPAISYATTAVSTSPSVTVIGDVNTSYTFTFTMPNRDVVVDATFGAGSGSVYHSITCVPSSSSPDNGYITANQATAAPGTYVSYDATPDAGYKLSFVTVTDASSNVIPAPGRTFVMPASNVTITAEFCASSSTSTVYQIGTVTGSWVNNSQVNSLIYVYTTENFEEVIYLGSEFGGQETYITSISWYFRKTSADAFTNPIRMYMREVTNTATSTSTDLSGFTLVYEGNLSQWGTGTREGWFEFPLPVPFKIDAAHKNLDVAIFTGVGSNGGVQWINGNTRSNSRAYTYKSHNYVNSDNPIIATTQTNMYPPTKIETNSCMLVPKIIIDPDYSHGTVTTSPADEAPEGSLVTINAVPDPGYSVELVVTDGNGDEVTVTDNQFIMPSTDVTIQATFTAIPYYITVVNNDPTLGTVSVSPANPVIVGQTITINSEFITGYKGVITVKDASNADVTVNYGADTTFVMPASDVTVTSHFYEAFVKKTNDTEDPWAGRYYMAYFDKYGQYGAANRSNSNYFNTTGVTLSAAKDSILDPSGLIVFTVEYAGTWTQKEVDSCGSWLVGQPYYHISYMNGSTKTYIGAKANSQLDGTTSLPVLKKFRWYLYEYEGKFLMKNFYGTTMFLYGYTYNNSTNGYHRILPGNNINGTPDPVSGFTENLNGATYTYACTYLYKSTREKFDINVNITGNGWVNFGGDAIRSNSNYIAYNGTIVTVTPTTKNDGGFNSLTVVDSDGNPVTVTSSDGVYQFTMPNKAVTINANFTSTDCMIEGQYDISDLSSPSKVIVQGTTANSSLAASPKMPYSPYHANNYKQILYSSATDPDGAIPAFITSIGFMYYVSGTTIHVDVKNNVTIYMGDTDATTLNDWVDYRTLTKVYDNKPLNFQAPSQNHWAWTDFNLDNTFTHDQSKNLIVVIHDHSANGPISGNRGFFYQETNGIVQLYDATGTTSGASGYSFGSDGKPVYASSGNAVTPKASCYYPITHFCGLPTYTVTCATGLEGGEISASPNSGLIGDGTETVTITAVPETGYRLASVTATNETTSETITLSGSGNTRTFTMPAANVTVTATFTDASGGDTWVDNVTSQPVGYVVDVSGNVTISSAEGLAWLISVVNGGESLSGKTVNLDADLDMDEHIWVPIGYSSSAAFAGTFNGNNHTISNLHITSAEISDVETAAGSAMQYTGLFGYAASGATVKNLYVKNATFANNATGGTLGGIVGTNAGTVQNCYSDAALSGTATAGGLVGTNNGTLSHSYTMVTSGATGSNSGTVTNCYYMAADNSSPATGEFTTAVAYTYGDYTTNNAVSNGTTTKPLVDWLNTSNPDATVKWMRTKGSLLINDGYPVLVPTTSSSKTDPAPAMAIAAQDGDETIYRGTAVEMITKYNSGASAATAEHPADIYVYSSGDLGNTAPNNANLHLFIDEDVAVTQNSIAADITATVGITFDNTATADGNPRDYHMFATPLKSAPLGITYTGDVEYGAGDEDVYAAMSFNTNGYFPSGIVATEVDFYDFSEPHYHWINLKRSPTSHFHEDLVGGIHANIPYDDNDGKLAVGNGYLLAIGTTGDNINTTKQVYLSATGTLTRVDTMVAVTKQGAHLTGYNYLGNPYQSYLDFTTFAETNKNVLWNGNDNYKAYLIYDPMIGGFNECLIAGESGVSFSQGSAHNASPYIHPHQAFFVVKIKNDPVSPNPPDSVKFTKAMRVTDRTSSFRNETPHYPLVNLFCTDDEGKKEISVIEVERPTAAGSLKMKDLLCGKGNMYIRWNNEDFGSLFIEGTPEYVPVWFKASEESIFTMSWNTANDNFGYLHLIDNLTGNDIDMLAAESYVFQSKPSDSKARFRIVFKPLGIEEETSTEAGENFAFINGNELVVTGEGELSLIDLNGRVLTTEHLSGQQSHIAMPNVAVGMYMLRLANSDGVKVQKIVVRK